MSDHRGGDEHTVPYAIGFCSAHQNGEDRECGYCYPNKRITEEQAVEVIKWLGIKSGPGKRWFHSNIADFFVEYIADWLYSAEGQEALRSKLLKDGKGIYEETGLVVISWPDETATGRDILRAVLEMIK